MTAMLVGLGVTLGSLVVQGMAATVGIEAISALMAKRLVGIHLWRNGAATLLLIMTLLTGHLAQMAVWAAAFVAAGQFETFTAAFYHSAVNYPTLGYGDMVMSKDWRLLVFGWSTDALVYIVILLVRQRHRARLIVTVGYAHRLS